MSYAKRVTISITTSSAGAATAYTSGLVNGEVRTVLWAAPTASLAFASTATITISGQVTGQTILANAASASFTVAPRQATHTATGGAALYAAGGKGVLAPFVVVDERIKAVVAGGGASKSGTLTLICA